MKLILVAVALIGFAAAQEKYTNKYDSIDVDEILKSDRLFKNYYKCLLDQGRCTPEGNELKRVLPEALETACAKCSERQRNTSARAIKFLSENRPAEWKVLRAKYDPNNRFSTRYQSVGRQQGIKL